jgi:hypothetical protein
MECVVLPLVRRHYPLLMTHSSSAQRLHTLLANVARSQPSLSQAEVWLEQAHLPAPLTMALREEVFLHHFFFF